MIMHLRLRPDGDGKLHLQGRPRFYLPYYWSAGVSPCCHVSAFRTPWGALHGAWVLHQAKRPRRVRRGPGRCPWDPDFALRAAHDQHMKETRAILDRHRRVHGRAGGTKDTADYDARPIEGGLPWGQYLTCGPGRVPLGVQPGETAPPGLSHLYVMEEEIPQAHLSEVQDPGQ